MCEALEKAFNVQLNGMPTEVVCVSCFNSCSYSLCQSLIFFALNYDGIKCE